MNAADLHTVFYILYYIMIYFAIRLFFDKLIDYFIFQPMNCNNQIPTQYKNFKVENDYIITKNRYIHYIYIHNPNTKYVTLFFHGNGGNAYEWMHSPAVDLMLKYSSVLVFDYSGYGKSRGRATENNAFEDSLNCWHLL